jgi:ligand-binding sensor domain-containing protein
MLLVATLWPVLLLPQSSDWSSVQAQALDIWNVFRAADAPAGPIGDAIYALLADDGVIWVGTDKGLSRYDGSRWDSYNPKTRSLLSSNVRDLLIDHQDQLWVATSEGVLLLGPERRWDEAERLPEGLRQVETLSLAPRQGVWIGTQDGAICWQCRQFGSSHPLHRSAPGETVRAIWPDTHGTVWFGVERGLLVHLQSDGSTERYTLADALESAAITALWGDNKRVLWVATEKGVCRLSLANPTDSCRVLEPTLGVAVSAFLPDDEGRVWLATDAGLWLIQDDQQVEAIRAFSIVGLSRDSVRSVTRDAEGQLWLGTTAGLARRTMRPWRNFMMTDEQAARTDVYAIAEDAAGMLWVGTTYGLLRHSPPGHWQEVEGLAGHRVTCLWPDEDESMWACLDLGIAHIKSVRDVSFPNDGQGLAGLHVNEIKRGPGRNGIGCPTAQSSAAGGLWLATGRGLRCWDGKLWHSYMPDSATGGPVNPVIKAIALDGDLGLWFGTQGGLSHYDGQHWLKNDPACPITEPVETLLLDNWERLWVGTDTGVVLCETGHPPKKWEESDGLARGSVRSLALELPHAEIYPTRTDAIGKYSLWVGTAQGISRINLALGLQLGLPVVTFGDKSMHHEFVRTILVGRDGNVLIGTPSGVWRYQPSTVAPQVRLSYLRGECDSTQEICESDTVKQPDVGYRVFYNAEPVLAALGGDQRTPADDQLYRYHIDDGKSVTEGFSLDGVIPAAGWVGPGETITVTVWAYDQDFNESDAQILTVTKNSVPLWLLPWIQGIIVAVLVFSVIYFLSVSVRQWLRVWLFRNRWLLAVEECNFKVQISQGEQKITLFATELPAESSSRKQKVSIPRDSRWPPQADQVQPVRSIFREGSTVRVEAEEQLFSRPWAHELGSGWSAGSQAIIAGQQLVTEKEQSGPRPKYYSPKVACAALRCINPQGHEPLTAPEDEIKAIVRCFRNWKAEVFTLDKDAAVGDLQYAMAVCDIVHVSAHATAEGIYLKDRFMDVDDLRLDLLETMRCRLLVLSACEAGQWHTDHGFVLRLVDWGVNVVAAVGEVNEVWSYYFFLDFYNAFLPSEKRQHEGTVFANAVRATSPKLAERVAEHASKKGRKGSEFDWQKTVDLFMLYGDPTLKLSFERRKRDEMNTDTVTHPKLSKLSSRQVNWERLTNDIRLTSAELGRTKGKREEAKAGVLPVPLADIEKAFQVFKDEFVKASTGARRMLMIFIGVLLLVLASAFVGVLLFPTTEWGGGILAAVGIAGLLGTVHQVYQLSRDVLMLDLIPAKYELALSLASSHDHYQTILDNLLAELHSLRN